MTYMAMWIRRTGVVTAVELMKIRFGEDRGGRMARTAGAVLMVTFLIFSIGYARCNQGAAPADSFCVGMRVGF